MKNPKEPIKPTSVWFCDTCQSKAEMTFEQMVEHCKAIHNIEVKGKKCKRSMVMHVDCADSFHSTYEIEVEGLKLTHSTSNPRHANDPMRYAE